MRFLITLASILALSTPVIAQECLTPDVILALVLEEVPDSVLVKVTDEPPFYMEFSSPLSSY